MEPLEPYAVVFAAQIHGHAATLPDEAREALTEALTLLMFSPWESARYHPRMPEEMRTATFGGGAGFLAFVISPKQKRVIITAVTWMG